LATRRIDHIDLTSYFHEEHSGSNRTPRPNRASGAGRWPVGQARTGTSAPSTRTFRVLGHAPRSVRTN